MNHSVSRNEIFNSEYYRLNKRFLVTIGQWPYQPKYKGILVAFIQMSLLISLFIPQCIAIWNYRSDVDILTECLSPVCVAFIATTLIHLWAINREIMKELLEDMIDDWKFWLPKPEVKILQKYAMRGRIMTLVYAIYIWSTGLTFINLPMIPVILDWIKPLNESRPKIPLYVAEYYVDQEKYFFPIMAHHYACSITCTSMIVIVETMFMVYTQHACGIFEILGFVENINAAFSTGFFIIMVVNTVMISVTGVQMVLKIGDLREGTRYALFTASQMFHFFFLSVPGQNLIDHSLEVQKHIYNGCWYELPVESQKLLLFMMRKTSEPCVFVAGVLFQFSMETFAAVVRLSMSYFTVLSSVH